MQSRAKIKLVQELTPGSTCDYLGNALLNIAQVNYDEDVIYITYDFQNKQLGHLVLLRRRRGGRSTDYSILHTGLSRS